MQKSKGSVHRSKADNIFCKATNTVPVIRIDVKFSNFICQLLHTSIFFPNRTFTVTNMQNKLLYDTSIRVQDILSWSGHSESVGTDRREIIYCKRAILSLSSSKILTPIPLSAWRVCPPPATKAGGTHSPGGEEDGGSIFWKTREIGLPSYSK
jgi:hypothetical protein